MSEINANSQPLVKKQQNNNDQSSNNSHEGIVQGQNGNIQKKRIHRKSDVSTFIMKTYRILDDKKNFEIVQWADEGNCFIVKNKQRFQSQILPKFFKHRKFSSFVRQLNMYDFHKIRKEKQIPIFKHKYFKMGGIDLLHKIKRKSGEQIKEQEGSINNLQSPVAENNIKAGSVTSKNYLNVQNEIESIMRQNGQIQKNIAQITQQINHLQMNKDRRKEKLMKMVSAMIFFDLKSKQNPRFQSLRTLQQHFIKEEQPWSFSQYSEHLSCIYSHIKSSIQ